MRAAMLRTVGDSKLIINRSATFTGIMLYQRHFQFIDFLVACSFCQFRESINPLTLKSLFKCHEWIAFAYFWEEFCKFSTLTIFFSQLTCQGSSIRVRFNHREMALSASRGEKKRQRAHIAVHSRSIYMPKKVQAKNVWGKRYGERENARLPFPAICTPRLRLRTFISKFSPEIARIFVLIRNIVAIRANVCIVPTWNPWRRAIYARANAIRAAHNSVATRTLRALRARVAALYAGGQPRRTTRKFTQSTTNIVIR